MLVTNRVDLSAKARDFLHASIRRDRYRRRRMVTVLSVLLVLALAAAGVAVVQLGRAQEGERIVQEQLRIATARQLAAQAEAIRGTDPVTALRLGLAAYRIHPTGETHASLINTLTSTHYANTLTSPVDGVSVAFSPDGCTLALGGRNIDGNNGIVILWDVADPTQPRQLG